MIARRSCRHPATTASPTTVCSIHRRHTQTYAALVAGAPPPPSPHLNAQQEEGHGARNGHCHPADLASGAEGQDGQPAQQEAGGVAGVDQGDGCLEDPGNGKRGNENSRNKKGGVRSATSQISTAGCCRRPVASMRHQRQAQSHGATACSPVFGHVPHTLALSCKICRAPLLPTRHASDTQVAMPPAAASSPFTATHSVLQHGDVLVDAQLLDLLHV